MATFRRPPATPFSPNKSYYSSVKGIPTSNGAKVKKAECILVAIIACVLFVPTASGQNQELPQRVRPDVAFVLDELCDTQFDLPKTQFIKEGYLEAVRPIAEAVRTLVGRNAEGMERLRQAYPNYNEEALTKKYTGLAVASLVLKCDNAREQMYTSLGADPQPNPSLVFIRDRVEAAFESAGDYDSLTRQQRQEFADTIEEWSVPYVGDDLQRQSEYLAYMLDSSEAYRVYKLRMAAEKSLEPETIIDSFDENISQLLDVASSVTDGSALANSSELWEIIIRGAEAEGYTVFTNAVSDMSDTVGFVSDVETWYAGTEIVFIVFVNKMAKANPFLSMGNGRGSQGRMSTFFKRMPEFEDSKYKIYSGKFTIPKTGDMWLAVGNRGWLISGRLVGLQK